MMEAVHPPSLLLHSRAMSLRQLVNRTGPAPLALETTLLAHGVPTSAARPLHDELNAIATSEGASPALIGLVGGTPIAGMTDNELDRLLAGDPPKLNTSNLGAAMHRGRDGATTVSATAEIAAAAGIRVFSTGGIGGVHRGFGDRLDISSDLLALGSFPVAVVASGVKSILDVPSTREALETLGIPVLGWRTEAFPAFYTRETDLKVDERFDDMDDLAAFVRAELSRCGRGILITNPIPEEHEIDAGRFAEMLVAASQAAAGAVGRDATPQILAHLHSVSDGQTLEANLALIRSNVRVGAGLAASLAGRRTSA